MIEVLKQALEALKDVGVLTDREWQAVHKNKANELRQAIAELESQEPVAWADMGTRDVDNDAGLSWTTGHFHTTPLYIHPPQRTEPVFCEYCGGNDENPPDHCMDCARPQRTWVGLTDEEIKTICLENGWDSSWQSLRFAQAIEAKLKEKNCAG